MFQGGGKNCNQQCSTFSLDVCLIRFLSGKAANNEGERELFIDFSHAKNGLKSFIKPGADGSLDDGFVIIILINFIFMNGMGERERLELRNLSIYRDNYTRNTNEYLFRSKHLYDPFNYKEGILVYILAINRVIYAELDDDHNLQTIKINKNVRLIFHYTHFFFFSSPRNAKYHKIGFIFKLKRYRNYVCIDAWDGRHKKATLG